MPRRALYAVMLGACAGAVALAIAAASDRRHLAFTPGVRVSQVAAVVAPGEEACQRGVDVENAFDAVQLRYGTFGRPGPALAMRVRDSASGRVLAAGGQRPGYPDDRPAVTATSPGVPAGRRVDVCVRNLGDRRVALWGGSASVPGATVGGRAANGDISLVFLRRRPRSALSLVPTIFRRAALFHPGWVGAWTFWLLLAALLIAVPALLCAALWRCASNPPGDRSTHDPGSSRLAPR